MNSLWKLCLIAGCLAAAPLSVQAADRNQKVTDDLDEDEEDDSLPGEAKARPQESKPVVEVARGFYMQMDPGAFNYMGQLQIDPNYLPFGVGVYWGHSMRLHLGVDFLTKSRFGLSGQATFWQAVNKAVYSPENGLLNQGATRTYLAEVAVRPTLLLGSAGRWNVYGRVGVGVGFLEQDRTSVPAGGIYSSFQYGLSPKPFISGGAGIEYYTRLSHFSFTFVEVNALYMPSLDVALGINFAGFKYTF